MGTSNDGEHEARVTFRRHPAKADEIARHVRVELLVIRRASTCEAIVKVGRMERKVFVEPRLIVRPSPAGGAKGDERSDRAEAHRLRSVAPRTGSRRPPLRSWAASSRAVRSRRDAHSPVLAEGPTLAVRGRLRCRRHRSSADHVIGIRSNGRGSVARSLGDVAKDPDAILEHAGRLADAGSDLQLCMTHAIHGLRGDNLSCKEHVDPRLPRRKLRLEEDARRGRAVPRRTSWIDDRLRRERARTPGEVPCERLLRRRRRRTRPRRGRGRPPSPAGRMRRRTPHTDRHAPS